MLLDVKLAGIDPLAPGPVLGVRDSFQTLTKDEREKLDKRAFHEADVRSDNHDGVECNV